MISDDEVNRAVEDVMLASYGRLVAYLAQTSGDIAAAEDALGDALAAAVESWRRDGVPRRPETWLLTVAKRRLIGSARRRATALRAEPMLERTTVEVPDDEPGSTIPDRRLELLYVCAHPAIEATVRAPLMLQTVFRLDAARIASSFLVSPTTMGQRLSRAKTRIRDAGVPFRVPDPVELPARTRNVLDAIYAAYGTGWDDPAGADARRQGLTVEALRLAHLVVELEPDNPEARGLLALLLHIEARRGARRDPAGRFVPLDQQDPRDWSRSLMADGEHQLSLALALRDPGPYQLEGAIQSVHNRRALTGVTDWEAVANLYDGLVGFAPSIGGQVARAAAYARAHGAAPALRLLEALPAERISDFQPYWATLASTLALLDRHREANEAARRAIGLTSDPAIRAHLVESYPPSD